MERSGVAVEHMITRLLDLPLRSEELDNTARRLSTYSTLHLPRAHSVTSFSPQGEKYKLLHAARNVTQSNDLFLS
jgi:hypothetical protein